MMLRYMLDTNTCIFAIKASATSKLAARMNRHGAQLCISSIVLAELRHGAENSKRVADNLSDLEEFVARLPAVLDFGIDAAEEFGRLKVALRAQPIGPMDTLIAAHARSRHLIIVTNNIAEFGRVPGLGVEDWL
jgi:tRNA(fMet)-specific endonuclease VapC